ncbi:hypothetical protein MO973_13045 [Paenibacillus sp. TRM 82003]|nr:hypothetical protein [Paenibacillus sp. TRM 82003]
MSDQSKQRLERAQAKDSTDQGRRDAFMTEDAWNLDGNPGAIVDEFGPDPKQEAPPTLNGKPTK